MGQKRHKKKRKRYQRVQPPPKQVVQPQIVETTEPSRKEWLIKQGKKALITACTSVFTYVLKHPEECWNTVLKLIHHLF